ncbi:MAG: hypothetical protein RLZZ373_1733, partial [Pseudomonadota bacterium]
MATDTHHYDALVGLQTAVLALTLDGIENADPLPAERVYLRELLDNRNVTLPCVMISKAPMPEMTETETSQHNKVSYPCLITVIVPQNKSLELTEGPTKWRQQIEEIFDAKQPAEVIAALGDTVKLQHTLWQPLDVIDLSAFYDKNLLVSAAIVLVVVWKSRGRR